MNNKTPVIYEGLMRVRFSDLDSYGHLSASHYIELVGTSRLYILEEKTGLSMAKLAEKGIGFYLKRAVVNYSRPVIGLVNIRQRSYISMIDKNVLVVSFTLTSEDRSVTHADGELHYVTIDLKTGRSMPLPDWFSDFMYE